jgi:hypothetical protein
MYTELWWRNCLEDQEGGMEITEIMWILERKRGEF